MTAGGRRQGRPPPLGPRAARWLCHPGVWSAEATMGLWPGNFTTQLNPPHLVAAFRHNAADFGFENGGPLTRRICLAFQPLAHMVGRSNDIRTASGVLGAVPISET